MKLMVKTNIEVFMKELESNILIKRINKMKNKMELWDKSKLN